MEERVAFSYFSLFTNSSAQMANGVSVSCITLSTQAAFWKLTSYEFSPGLMTRFGQFIRPCCSPLRAPFGIRFVALQNITTPSPIYMNEETIREQYRQIISLLKQQRLKEAQAQLEVFMWNTGNESLYRQLEQVQTSYHYLLQYMRAGVEDRDKDKLHRKFMADTWKIADQTLNDLLDKNSGSLYHTLRRRHKAGTALPPLSEERKLLEAFPDDWGVRQLVPGDELNGKQLLLRHEEVTDRLFYRLWENTAWSTEEIEGMDEFLNSRLISITDLGLLVSAVMLSLLECFDPFKFAWLLEAYTHPDSIVSQRALVSIVIVICQEPDRLPLYPELSSRLLLLNEDGKLSRQLNYVYRQLLNSQETEKIDKKMREEILPGVMKSMRDMKFGFEDPTDENDRNPDWEEAIQKSGLENKLREMGDLQQEGADIYMSTFSTLKKFPFFRQFPNWFRPFDMLHSDIWKEYTVNAQHSNNVLDIMLKSSLFCDSDKYSLCLLLKNADGLQRNIMLNNFSSMEAEDEDILDSQRAANGRNWGKHPEVVSNQYIHSLYRFFKLNEHRKEFYNIFDDRIALHELPGLKEMLCRPDLLKEVGDFHFNKEHSTEALEIYRTLIEQKYADADTFQKAGFCLQKEKRYTDAINAYRKADVLKPDYVWTLHHLAACYRLSKDYVTALEYYKKVENIRPEDTRILFHAGSCLAEMERYDEALQYFFKMDFMENNCIKAWRAIGWCSFLAHKYEQAMKYYEKVIASNPLPADYMNAGHVAWAQKNIDSAAGFYAQAVMAGGSKDAFLELFDKDRDILLQQGIDEKDIPLVLDLF